MRMSNKLSSLLLSFMACMSRFTDTLLDAYFALVQKVVSRIVMPALE